MLIQDERFVVGALVWIGEGAMHKWNCPGEIVKIDQKTDTLIITYDDFKVGRTSIKNNRVSYSTKEQITEYLIKSIRDIELNIGEMKREILALENLVKIKSNKLIEIDSILISGKVDEESK